MQSCTPRSLCTVTPELALHVERYLIVICHIYSVPILSVSGIQCNRRREVNVCNQRMHIQSWMGVVFFKACGVHSMYFIRPFVTLNHLFGQVSV